MSGATRLVMEEVSRNLDFDLLYFCVCSLPTVIQNYIFHIIKSVEKIIAKPT
jgi:hypothetical protein